jgi:hypothetical protein
LWDKFKWHDLNKQELHLLLKNKVMELGMVGYTCNPSTWEAGAGESEVQIQACLGYTVRPCLKNKNKNRGKV